MTPGRLFPAALAAAASLALAVVGAPSQALAQAFVNLGDGVFATHVVTLRDMPFRTVVRQRYDYSCGSASLATLLKHHYGRPVDEAAVFKAMYAVGDQAKIRKVGFSLLDMKTYLKSIGLSSDGYREDLQDLQASTAPAIAVVQIGAYRHFVVVKGARGGRILIGDPAQGLKAYKASDFAKIWSGVIFKIHAGGSFNRPEEWGALPRAPTAPLDEGSLSGFTRELPPIYQITAVQTAAP